MLLHGASVSDLSDLKRVPEDLSDLHVEYKEKYLLKKSISLRRFILNRLVFDHWSVLPVVFSAYVPAFRFPAVYMRPTDARSFCSISEDFWVVLENYIFFIANVSSTISTVLSQIAEKHFLQSFCSA